MTERYAPERVRHLEQELVTAITGNDGSVLLDHPHHDDQELHILVRVSISEAHLVRSFYGIGMARDEMPGLASDLAVALGMAVDIYGGPGNPDGEWPSCGCELIGCADANGVVLPSPRHQVMHA